MSRQGAAAFQIGITATPEPGDALRVTWRWRSGSFERTVSQSDLLQLTAQSEALSQSIRKAARGIGVHREMLELGRRLGVVLVGSEQVGLLWDALASELRSFILCSIAGDCSALASLPWESLVLPGTAEPLLFHPRLRARFDYVRSYVVNEVAWGRRTAAKVLAAWSQPVERDTLVEAEVEKLRLRLARHSSIRFRWVRNPKADELRTRLRAECLLFLYAGHGELEGGTYRIELGDDWIDVRGLLTDLRTSLAEVLIFDSCDSGRGSATQGLPSLLSELPNTDCLLGFWGPENDIISTWHMPSVVEDLILGVPVWTCINQLRILLYDQGVDAWFQPIMHLKQSYRPVDALSERRSYLNALQSPAPRPHL